ncbi:MAG TPA: hypothetical protein VM915_11440 [Verrucomicrobiae bacterium]|nr:hypothetical protein [Verrucomicrobiae bacterium]
MIEKSALASMAACAVLALAGCAQSNSSAEIAASAPAAPPPAASAAPAQAPAPAPAKQAALTPEQAKGQCWMKYENDRRAKSIDERLKLVEKCVDDTMRNQPPPPPQR